MIAAECCGSCEYYKSRNSYKCFTGGIYFKCDSYTPRNLIENPYEYGDKKAFEITLKILDEVKAKLQKKEKMWEELKANFETLLALGNKEGYSGLSKMNQLEKEAHDG